MILNAWCVKRRLRGDTNISDLKYLKGYHIGEGDKLLSEDLEPMVAMTGK